MILKEKAVKPVAEGFIKVVVDIARGIVAYGCDLHVDCAEELFADGSAGKDVWGANVYMDTGKIVFVSLINVRPAQGNKSMEIEDSEVRKQVEGVIRKLLL